MGAIRKRPCILTAYSHFTPPMAQALRDEKIGPKSQTAFVGLE